MYEGKIVAERDGRSADKNEIGLLMATGGAKRPEQETPSGTGTAA